MQIVPWKLKQGVYFYWITPASSHFGKNFPKETCLCFHSFLRNFLKNCHFKVGTTREDKYYPLVMIEWIHNFIQLKISWKWLEPVCISYFNVFICVFYLLFKRKQFKMKILQLGGKLLVLCEVLCWLTPWLNFII